MRILKIIFNIILLLAFKTVQGQDCLVLSLKQGDACLLKIEAESKSLKRLQRSAAGTLESLFFAYFEGSDYSGYKQLFLPADWYGLSPEEFGEWRLSVRNAKMEILGQMEINSQGKDLGIIKYGYSTDDMFIYETFLAKKMGSKWYPVSAKEEQDFIELTNAIKYTKVEFLYAMSSATIKANDATNLSGAISGGKISGEKMMKSKDSLSVFAPELFKQYFNNEFAYITDAKFREDRLNDVKFIAYLQEIQLTTDQTELVMKFIKAQDYLRAAQKADEFSSVTYTYAQPVDKIREIYGRDRIKKWDQANQKWD